MLARKPVLRSMAIVTSFLITFGLAGNGAAQAADSLFLEAPSEALSATGTGGSGPGDGTVLRTGTTLVDFDLRKSAGAEKGSSEILLNLFPDVSLLAVGKGKAHACGKWDAWQGRIADMPLSSVVLVFRGETLAGNITARGTMYQIRPLTAGLHEVRQIDQSAFPPEAQPLIPEGLPEGGGSNAPALLSTEEVTIDVMVVYTADAAAAAGDIEAEIALGIVETNMGYENSGVIQRVNLVHSAEVTYTESGDATTDLLRLKLASDGHLDEVHEWRNLYYADIVSLWVRSFNYCGIGYQMLSVSPEHQGWAFNVVKLSCATGYYTFGHEMGHNMGAHHDWYVHLGVWPYPYSHGFVNAEDRWRTIMAYNDECGDQGFSCTRLLHWSNPGVDYGGDPMGVPEGSENLADNHLSLDNTAATVAAFREEGTPPPWSVASDAQASVLHGTTEGDSGKTVGCMSMIAVPFIALILLRAGRGRREGY